MANCSYASGPPGTRGAGDREDADTARRPRRGTSWHGRDGRSKKQATGW
jgi:hypothetical protein